MSSVDPAFQNDPNEPDYDQNYDPLPDFRKYLEDRYVKVQAIVRHGDDTFLVKVESGGWLVYIEDEGVHLDRNIPPMPAYIPEDRIIEFWKWFSQTIENAETKARREGRKYGEQQMGIAIRSLIGAADLVDLESVHQRLDQDGY